MMVIYLIFNTTSEIRSRDWKVAQVPEDLQNRKVEIIGPTDRKMVINALNSGQIPTCRDFEDSNTQRGPTKWMVRLICVMQLISQFRMLILLITKAIL